MYTRKLSVAEFRGASVFTTDRTPHGSFCESKVDATFWAAISLPYIFHYNCEGIVALIVCPTQVVEVGAMTAADMAATAFVFADWQSLVSA